MEIDIRNAHETEKITHIRFADKSSVCSKVLKTHDGDYIGVDGSIIRVSDIPNLIKALEKAYEIKGGK